MSTPPLNDLETIREYDIIIIIISIIINNIGMKKLVSYIIGLLHIT